MSVHPRHWRAIFSDAARNGAKSIRIFFWRLRSSFLAVLGFGFMQGMVGSAVANAGAAVGRFVLIVHRPADLLQHRANLRVVEASFPLPP